MRPATGRKRTKTLSLNFFPEDVDSMKALAKENRESLTRLIERTILEEELSPYERSVISSLERITALLEKDTPKDVP